MDMPSLPTDNLYKFLAIGGVAMLITSIVYPVQRSESDLERIFVLLSAQNDEASKIAEEYVKSTTDSRKCLNDSFSAYSEFLGAVKGVNLPEEQAKRLEEMAQKQLDANLREIEMRDSAMKLRGTSTAALMEKINYEVEARPKVFPAVVTAARWLGSVGVVLAGVGFGLWYWKVQRYHDRIILAELAKAETDLLAPSQATQKT